MNEIRGRWYKLTPNQVRRIRKLYFRGLETASMFSMKSFSKQYNVSVSTIRDAITGKNWGHIK